MAATAASRRSWPLSTLSVAVLFVCACVLASTKSAAADPKQTNCLLCTAIVAIADNAVYYREQEFVKEATTFCALLSGEAETICSFLVGTFGADILTLITSKVTASTVCPKLGLCSAQCILPPPIRDAHTAAAAAADTREDDPLFAVMLAGAVLRLSSVSRSASFSSSSTSKYDANPDLDGDGFGPFHSYRGADWRGRDCNDLVKAVRPGLAEDFKSPFVDNDCNGVFGWSAEKYCGSSEARYVVAFGDSASSAFNLPANWTRLEGMGNLLRSVVDEMDNPQLSYITGWETSQAVSLYSHIRSRNLCNHRQYANVGWNGAEMENLVQQVELLQLSAGPSKPLLATVAYIGNDVCADTLEEMTTVVEYEAQLLAGLRLLDSVAAPNSKVLLLGLVDGSILYNVSQHLNHPLGGTVPQFYDFLSCTGSNPCRNYLTSNATQRALASQRAAELSLVLEQQASTLRLQNLELAYMPFPLEKALAYLAAHKIPAEDLIGHVDFFHPSMFGQTLIGRFVVEFLQENYAGWLGPENGYNAEIVKYFGNQGGY